MEHYIYRGTDQPAWKFKTRLSYCQIWQNSISHIIAQAYHIQNLQHAQVRINCNKQHVVTAFNTYRNQNGKYYLLVQRIPNRLSEVFALNQSQALKVLYSIFKGLIELDDKYGNISLTQNCICFNQAGKVKIWINPNISSLIPTAIVKQHDDEYLSIIKNIYHLIRMVQRKCFNRNILKKLIYKVSQYKIKNYWEVIQEIIRISQMLFLDVQQKYANFNKKKQQNKYKLSNQNFRQKQQKQKLLKTQFQQTSYQKQSGHYRKFSNHQNNQITKFKKQPVPINFTLNFNKFPEIQAIHGKVTSFHRSAQLSPRQSQFPTNNKELPLFTERKQIKQKLKGQITNNPSKKKEMVCQTIYQDISQCDDSFSNQNKIQNKQTLVQGQFKTFGILEDSMDNYNKQKNSEENISALANDERILSRKESDFDIELMDLQIQKKITKKAKEQYEKRASMKKTLEQNQTLLYQLNSNIDYNKTASKVGFYRQKQKSISTNVSFQRNSQKQTFKNKQNTQGIILNHIPKQNLTYIDKKYQQYIRNQSYKKSIIGNTSTVALSGQKHGKNISNLQNNYKNMTIISQNYGDIVGNQGHVKKVNNLTLKNQHGFK